MTQCETGRPRMNNSHELRQALLAIGSSLDAINRLPTETIESLLDRRMLCKHPVSGELELTAYGQASYLRLSTGQDVPVLSELQH